MKDHRSCTESLPAAQTLHDKTMGLPGSRPARRRAVFNSFAAALTCAVLVLTGFWAFSYLFSNKADRYYYFEASGADNSKDELSELVHLVVEGGAADFSQITPDFIPEWRDEEFSLSQAQSDPDFGRYVPKSVPAGFAFESARRFLDQNRDGMRIDYCSGMKYISLVVSRQTAEHEYRMADLSRPETYDLALYPIPRAESVPAELREIVDNPVFRVEDLTLEAVKARAYTVSDAGDDNEGFRMRFSVLYKNAVVKLNVKGAQPEDIFSMAKGFKDGLRVLSE